MTGPATSIRPSVERSEEVGHYRHYRGTEEG